MKKMMVLATTILFSMNSFALNEEQIQQAQKEEQGNVSIAKEQHKKEILELTEAVANLKVKIAEVRSSSEFYKRNRNYSAAAAAALAAGTVLLYKKANAASSITGAGLLATGSIGSALATALASVVAIQSQVDLSKSDEVLERAETQLAQLQEKLNQAIGQLE